MKVLVTGAKGFIGRNLISELERRENVEVMPFDIDSPAEALEEYCRECNFVFNRALIVLSIPRSLWRAISDLHPRWCRS